jgi:hypothetical protein
MCTPWKTYCWFDPATARMPLERKMSTPRVRSRRLSQLLTTGSAAVVSSFIWQAFGRVVELGCRSPEVVSSTGRCGVQRRAGPSMGRTATTGSIGGQPGRRHVGA